MLKDNSKRLYVWLSLDNRFDYKQFTAACIKNGIEPLPALEFSHKAGMAACGINAYPDIAPSDAYLKFIQDNQDMPQMVAPSVVPESLKRGCNSCGGGSVR